MKINLIITNTTDTHGYIDMYANDVSVGRVQGIISTLIDDIKEANEGDDIRYIWKRECTQCGRRIDPLGVDCTCDYL